MSWLIVAKMPLLMSSRITSAGFTTSRSASSLTVIVAGSSIAPRSRGSATWTLDDANAASRRGGLRGPRRPRVPLLLRAMLSSLGQCRVVRGARREVRPEVIRERHLERARDLILLNCLLPARAVGAEVGSATGEPTGWIQLDRARGRPH